MFKDMYAAIILLSPYLQCFWGSDHHCHRHRCCNLRCLIQSTRSQTIRPTPYCAEDHRRHARTATAIQMQDHKARVPRSLLVLIKACPCIGFDDTNHHPIDATALRCAEKENRVRPVDHELPAGWLAEDGIYGMENKIRSQRCHTLLCSYETQG
jgi:hypothetical protein